MRGTLGNIQLISQGLHLHATGITSEAFEKAERAFDLTAGHENVLKNLRRF